MHYPPRQQGPPKHRQVITGGTLASQQYNALSSPIQDTCLVGPHSAPQATHILSVMNRKRTDRQYAAIDRVKQLHPLRVAIRFCERLTAVGGTLMEFFRHRVDETRHNPPEPYQTAALLPIILHQSRYDDNVSAS